MCTQNQTSPGCHPQRFVKVYGEVVLLILLLPLNTFILGAKFGLDGSGESETSTSQNRRQFSYLNQTSTSRQ